jgi:hypothetical protein
MSYKSIKKSSKVIELNVYTETRVYTCDRCGIQETLEYISGESNIPTGWTYTYIWPYKHYCDSCTRIRNEFRKSESYLKARDKLEKILELFERVNYEEWESHHGIPDKEPEELSSVLLNIKKILDETYESPDD